MGINGKHRMIEMKTENTSLPSHAYIFTRERKIRKKTYINCILVYKYCNIRTDMEGNGKKVK